MILYQIKKRQVYLWLKSIMDTLGARSWINLMCSYSNWMFSYKYYDEWLRYNDDGLQQGKRERVSFYESNCKPLSCPS